MSNYPEEIDVFVDKTGSDYIASSDPNVAYAGIETTQGLIGGLGKPQSWSATLLAMLAKYKLGLEPYIDDSGDVIVRSGKGVLENTDATKFVFRKNPGAVTLAAGNLDTGTLAATNYYIYATALTATTTTPLLYSTDMNAPSGIGTAPYLALGWFYNGGAGSLTPTWAGAFNSANFADSSVVTGTAVVTSTGFEAIPGIDTIYFTASGNKPVHIEGGCVSAHDSANQTLQAIIEIDDVEQEVSESGNEADDAGLANERLRTSVRTKFAKILTFGSHKIVVKWRVHSGTGFAYQRYLRVWE